MNARLLAVGLVLAAGSAAAQTYTVQSQAQAYAPITGGTTATLVKRDAAASFPAEDEGYFNLPLGFTFPYYGQNYTSVHVDTNGFLLFGTANKCNGPPGGAAFDCFIGGGFPSLTRVPHNVIAPWWDDLDKPQTGTASIQYKGTSSQMEIEWSNWACFGGSCGMSFKVTLTASGQFLIHYGTMTGATADAAVGWENDIGSAGGAFLGCGTTTNNCGVANWTPNMLWTIGQPVQPDIAVTAVNIANLAVTATNITFDVTPTFQNFGQMAASPAFGWKAYLSTDKVLQTGTDVLVHTAAPAITLTGAGTAGATAVATGAAATPTLPPPGQYYVLVEADHTNTVAEANESNNVGSALNYFVNGLDLVATAVSGPAMSGPGNAMTVNVKWFNQGTDAAGTVAYQVLLSTDATASTNDFVLSSGSRMVSGGETIDENVVLTVPVTVPGGDLFYLLRLDPQNLITEASEANNAVASVAKVNVSQADLVNTASDFLNASTMAATRVGDFGQAALVSMAMSNAGGANANNFKVAVVLSTDSNLSLLSDTIVYEQTVSQLLSGGVSSLNLAFTMPLNNAASQPFASGNYYVFTLADSNGTVTELSEFNNARLVIGPVFMRAPGFDGGSGGGGGAGGGAGGGTAGGAGGGTAGGAGGGTAGGAGGGTAGGAGGGTAGGAGGGTAGGAGGGTAGGAGGGTAGGAGGGTAGGAGGGTAGGAGGGTAGGAGGGTAGGAGGGMAGGAGGGMAGGAGGGSATDGGAGGGAEMPKGCGCASGSDAPAWFALIFLARFAHLRRRSAH